MVVDDLGLEALGVFQHAIHQLGSLQALYVTRPVVDIRGRHELATLLDARNDDRIEVRPRRVHGSRITGWAGSQDDNSAMS